MATAEQEFLDVRRAAELVDRHPETIRRWIWTGKLDATRRGNRLMVERRALLEAIGDPSSKLTLSEWAELAREVRERRPLEAGETDSVELIRQGREERTQRILDAGR